MPSEHNKSDKSLLMHDYTPDQIFERHYLVMRPLLILLTGGDQAAIRSFDRCYRELLERVSGKGDGPSALKEVLPRRQWIGVHDAKRLLQKDFDDCLPVGHPEVKW